MDAASRSVVRASQSCRRPGRSQSTPRARTRADARERSVGVRSRARSTDDVSHETRSRARGDRARRAMGARGFPRDCLAATDG